VFEGLTIPADIADELKINIARRLTPQPVKVRADLEVTNFAYSGILAIQSALAAGEALSTPEIPIKIRLVAPPLYVMVSNTTDKAGAIARLEKAIEIIEKHITKEEGGSLNVKMKPKAVSETDELELAALMDRVARENKEVSGESHFSSLVVRRSLTSLLGAQVTKTRRERHKRDTRLCFIRIGSRPDRNLMRSHSLVQRVSICFDESDLVRQNSLVVDSDKLQRSRGLHDVLHVHCHSSG
jgi:hypothetical protein